MMREKLIENGFLDFGSSVGKKDYGKYGSGLLFIVNNELIDTFFSESESGYIKPNYYLSDKSILNKVGIEYSGSISKYIYGTYRKNAKGTNIFQVLPEAQAKHLLIEVSWGGSFDRSRGVKSTEGSLYYKHASSNGGGTGNDFIIIEKNYKRVMDLISYK